MFKLKDLAVLLITSKKRGILLQLAISNLLLIVLTQKVNTSKCKITFSNNKTIKEVNFICITTNCTKRRRSKRKQSPTLHRVIKISHRHR